jgi:hypothetical protein
MPSTATPNAAPEKGSAKDRLFKKLSEKAKPMAVDEPAPAPAPSKSATEAPEAEPSTSPPSPPESTEATAAPDKKKVNPWKLIDEYKAKAKELESRILESEKRAIPEAQWKDMQTKLEERQKKLDELEGEIRYVNYSKSDEFKQKYEEPYKKAWSRAMSELDGIMVQEGEGERAISADDILEVANMPLAKAKMLAQEKFGDFAPEVLANAREIRKLYDEQATALDGQRKASEEREKTRAAESTQLRSSIVKDWNEFNERVQSHDKYGPYFRPVEGDTDGNQRLAKGFELADRAFSENPAAAGLTTEQRKSIIERHAVVRNRCAAFGRLVAREQQKDSRIAELEKELAQYKGSEPDAAGRQPPVEPAKPGSAMSRLSADLRKIAK